MTGARRLPVALIFQFGETTQDFKFRATRSIWMVRVEKGRRPRGQTMISLQTNTNSLVAPSNLNVNRAFQSKTIQRLTSGYRINSSSDDAAGLSVASPGRKPRQGAHSAAVVHRRPVAGERGEPGSLEAAPGVVNHLRSLGV